LQTDWTSHPKPEEDEQQHKEYVEQRHIDSRLRDDVVELEVFDYLQ
jgi:hypothetical protein